MEEQEKTQTTAFDPHIIERFISLQERELEVRQSELTVRNNEIDVSRYEAKNNKEIAIASIDAQARLHEKQASVYTIMMQRTHHIIIAISLIIVGFLITAMLTGHSDFAEKVMYLLVGALGGYGASNAQKNTPKEPTEN